jgi:hypothetical protein
MFSIRKMKSVSTIEQEWKQLQSDFQIYTEIEESKKLKDFLALKEKVESAPFRARKKEIELLKYNGSPEEKLVRRFSKLEKNSNLISYYKTLASDDLKKFKKLTDNNLAGQLKELESYLKSDKYHREKEDFKKKSKDKSFNGTWESTDACKKEKEYKNLLDSSDYQFFIRFSKSNEYKNFKLLDGSTLVSDFENLKNEVSSDKFSEIIAYLKDKDRYLKTDDYKALTQYNGLKNDNEIKLYFKYNETDSFKFFREWDIVLDENFTSKSDKNKWSFISPLAEKGPGNNFSVKDQLQYYDLDNNFMIENGILTLETNDRKKEGLYWDENFGFVLRNFDYTSGLMHSLNFFKQEYGLFEVKLKASKIKGVISSVSLVDEDETNCIRMVSLESKNATGGLIYTQQGQRQFSKINLKFKPGGYVIVGVKWSPEKIEWLVNERLVGSQTQNIPHEKLGIRIETEVMKTTSNLPHRLDIDWIKCYKRKS